MPILFFDGECVLCNRSAHRVARLNTSENIHFASLQDKLAQQKHKALALNTGSTVFLDGDHIFIKSEAIFETLKHLPSLRWLGFLRVFPLKFRDLIYDFIAKNRIKWFGRQEHCKIPPKEFRGRYLSN